MQRLHDHQLRVHLQILDNESSAEYKWVIKEKCKIDYQFVPPNTHRSNTAKISIPIFKAHFISVLAYVSPDFLNNLWDILILQTEVTLNLLQQANFDPSRSALAYFLHPFNYDATPLGPIGCHIIAHKKTGTRKSWNFRGAAGWNACVALQHYHCHTIVYKSTKAVQVLDTVEFRHHHLTLPDLTPADYIVHGVTHANVCLTRRPYRFL